MGNRLPQGRSTKGENAASAISGMPKTVKDAGK